MSFLAKLRLMISFVAGASIPYGLSFAGVALLVYEDYRGQESSLGSALRRVMRRLLPVAVLSFLVGCGALFGAFLFLVPGLLVTMLTPFAVPVLLLEETGIVTALRRSMHLAWSRIGTVFGLMLTLAIVWNLVVAIYFWWIRTLSLEGVALAEAIWVLLAVALPIVMCVYCTTLTSLTMSAVSSTFKAHLSADSEEYAFPLSLKLLLLLLLLLYQPRLARNLFSGPELSPTHASLRSQPAIMITTSNSP